MSNIAQIILGLGLIALAVLINIPDLIFPPETALAVPAGLALLTGGMGAIAGGI